MLYAEVGSTRPSMLGAVADWGDQQAWDAFRRRYDPLLSACCRRLGLDAAATDDVVQETWIQVANRMRSFVYDPDGSFRGWLWRVCRYEAIDHLKKRRAEATVPLDDRDEFAAARGVSVDPTPDPDGDGWPSWFAGRRREAERIQAEVRRRVEPQTWEAFRLVCLEIWTVKEAARHLGTSEANVYKAVARVRKRLGDEGARALDRPTDAERP
ncbi:RNA polymerase sigma factor [Paludisphaera mucosa]|uniref:Sigma-70 family RNA polymerase sigma factor n=1 Tax=Paludisphaera mucosa TaxID=3030827 RepID=A0ABT6FC64_9BACT|nr:sigma-70 family RNA polymerase sigma factor [Paludisphaera mucosa]MDG3005044.1 sigma-70 family RNA polymerase sigma factor [Paludisphaera mucosa]